MPDADRLELATIPRWKEVPRSTPATFVRTFNSFCVEGPGDMQARDAVLRSSGYVPKTRPKPGAARAWVVDDLRPAIVSGGRICGARARARTGQTDAVQGYIAETFPQARALDTGQFGPEVEQAWQVEGGVLATTRSDWVGNASSYTLLLYRPGA